MVTTTLAKSMAAACGASASGSPRLARRARARGTPVNTGARSARKPRTTVWSMGGDDKEKSDTLGNLDAMLGTSQVSRDVMTTTVTTTTTLMPAGVEGTNDRTFGLT